MPITRQSTAATPTSMPLPIATATPSPTPDRLATARARGCEVTAYSPDKPALPTSQNQGQPAETPWYHSGDLWLSIVKSGNAITKQWYTGRTSVRVVSSTGHPLTITGRLPGNDAAQFMVTSNEFEEQPAGEANSTPVSVASMNITTSGCWRINVAAGQESLDLTVYVEPYALSPAITDIAERERQADPFPVPASCQVTRWLMPGSLPPLDPSAYEFTISHDGLEMVAVELPLWAGQGQQLSFPMSTISTLTLTGHLVNDPSITLRSSLIEYTHAGSNGSNNQGWNADVLFPKGGCWQVTATAGSKTLSAVLYIYPANCAHDYGTPVPAACQEP